MKRNLLLLLYLLMPFIIMAEDISEEQAKLIAEQFFTTENSANGQRRAPEVSPQLNYASEGGELYVFNKADGEGWVIVAGNDGAPSSILAFSDTGSFDYEKAPDAAKSILSHYAENIRGLRHTTGLRRAGPYDIFYTKMNIVVEPLLKTTWNQNTPYNNYCREIDGAMEGSGGRSPVGCVPVAVAQIMNYWQWPKRGSGKHSNTQPSMNQTVDFSQSVYDWDNMLNAYTEGAYNDAQAHAVAQLMRDVGCALNTIYLPGESPTNTDYLKHKMEKYFGYRLEEFSTGNSIDIIKNELKSGRPVLGVGQLNSNYEFHEYVIDGYGEGKVTAEYYQYEDHPLDYLHINLGWGGQSDGFYIDFLPFPDDTQIASPFRTMVVDYYGIQPSTLPRVEKDNVFFDLSDGEAQVVCCKEGNRDEDVTIVIPSEVEYEGKSYPVTSIYPDAFHEAYVARITFPGTIKKIPAYAFAESYGGNHVKHVAFNEGLDEIGDSAFYSCDELSAFINFPSTLRRIGKGAFSGAKDVSGRFNGKGFVIDDSGLASYSAVSFYGLEKAAKIGHSGVGRLKGGDFIVSPTCNYSDDAIYGTVDNIILPAGLTTYRLECFNVSTAAYQVRKDNPKYCASSEGVLFSKDMKTLIAYPTREIRDGELYERDLAYIPAGTTKIGRRAFWGGNIGNLTIPASVKELDGAFYDTRVKYIYMLSSTPPVINDDSTFPASYVNEAGRKSKLFVPHGSLEAYRQANGWKNFEQIEESVIYVQGQFCYEIYSTELASIVARNASGNFDGHAVIPATVNINGVNRKIDDIQTGAFHADLELKTVTLPKELEYISARFIGCDNLYAINVNAGSTTMYSTDGMLFAISGNGKKRLEFCPPMQQKGSNVVARSQVVIPNGTNEIVGNALTKTLRRITIPASVEEIRDDAFIQCTNLKNIICQGTTPPAFNDGGTLWPSSVYKKATVYVPKGSLNAYKGGNWPYNMFCDFENFVEYDPATFNPNSIDDGNDDEEPADPEFYDPNNPDFPDESGDSDDPDEPEVQEGVAVHRTNGQVEYFSFAGHPKVTYEGDNLVMSCGNTRVLYTLKGLEKITFGSFTTSIDDNPISESLSFHFDNDQIQIANAKAGETIRIYNAAGRLVHLLHADGDGPLTIPLDTLPAGVYIIQLSKTTYKVLKQ